MTTRKYYRTKNFGPSRITFFSTALRAGDILNSTWGFRDTIFNTLQSKHLFKNQDKEKSGTELN